MTSRGKTAEGELSGDGGLLLTSLKVDRVSMANGGMDKEEGGARPSELGWTLDGKTDVSEKNCSNSDKPAVFEIGQCRNLQSFKRIDSVPEVWKEASCCVAAVSLKGGSRRSKVRRLLDAQQPPDSTQNLQTSSEMKKHQNIQSFHLSLYLHDGHR